MVGRRRLTPIQLGQLRVDVLGEKVKSVILRKCRGQFAKEIRPVPASRLGEGWSENLTDLRCVSKARVCKVKVAEIRRPKIACKENIHFFR